MSLWKRLSESRKKGKIKFYIHGGPVEGARFIDFREMEDEAIEAIREYSSKPLGEISRELEMRVCDAILKYLLMNFTSKIVENSPFQGIWVFREAGFVGFLHIWSGMISSSVLT